jgi:cellobiose phosphorylase
LIEYYKTIRESVAKGVETYALLKDERGFAKMVHGWGEDRSYFVGSFSDHDGASRISLTSNAFCAISGIMENFPEYKEDIIKNITDLDSRFGLLTFDKPFVGYAPHVGRLTLITPGTYENACTYVHAGMFGAQALFSLGASKQAWDAIEKGMVISHDKVTMSTFVMPNSYCIDGDYDFDGESMGDWYTGSGAVLIKNFIKYAFGVEPDMNNLKIIPTAYFPSNSAQITLPVCDKMITLKYENRKLGERKIYLNGKELPLEFDKLREVNYAIIAKTALTNDCTILVTD